MEWLTLLLQKESLVLLIPIIAIIGGFSIAALKAHYKHQERIEKIKQGLDPEN